MHIRQTHLRNNVPPVYSAYYCTLSPRSTPCFSRPSAARPNVTHVSVRCQFISTGWRHAYFDNNYCSLLMPVNILLSLFIYISISFPLSYWRSTLGYYTFLGSLLMKYTHILLTVGSHMRSPSSSSSSSRHHVYHGHPNTPVYLYIMLSVSKAESRTVKCL